VSRLPATGLRAARPAATPWLLLALTALAALLGAGLEPGRLPDPGARLLAVDGTGAPGETDRRTEARVPFVGAVLSAAPSPAGPPAELATPGSTLVLGAPFRLGPLPDDLVAETDAPGVRRSGRAPPVTTGT
jgi:hypothetical protein